MVELTYPAYVVESNPGTYQRECAVPLDKNVQVCGIFGGIRALLLLQHSLHQHSLLKWDEKLERIWAITQFFIFFIFLDGYESFPVLPLWLFLIIIIYIAHSYDSDENERELYDNKCKECIWMHNSQGEILAFLFGRYMCATLSVRVGEILGGWRKHVVRDFVDIW